MSPTIACLLLAVAVVFARLCRFQPWWFVTRSSLPQPLWVRAAVSRQLSRNLATVNGIRMGRLRYLKVCQASTQPFDSVFHDLIRLRIISLVSTET